MLNKSDNKIVIFWNFEGNNFQNNVSINKKIRRQIKGTIHVF